MFGSRSYNHPEFCNPELTVRDWNQELAFDSTAHDD
jgi:hypothetical protein